MDERKMEFRTGLAVVIGLIILAALVIFAGGLNFLRDYYNIKAVFKTAGGIKRGAPVRMAGVEIGRVKSISIETEPDMTSFISMTVEIERGYKIPTDSRIAITSDSLLGERLLEITPGTTSAHLQPGETLSKMGTTPGTLEDALKEVPGIVEKLSLTVESINKIVSDPKVQNDFRRAIEKIADSAANAEGLIKDARSVIAENRDNVNSAIQNFADTSAQAKEFIGKLQGIETEIADTIKSLDKELRTFTKRINDPEIFEKITNALDKFEQLPEQMTKLVKTLQDLSEGDIAKVLEKSDKIAEEVYATVLQARQDLEEIAASFKQTIELTRSGDGLIAALLSDRKMKHKLNNMLDQGIYLLEHPIMFILKGGYKERKEPPDIEEEEEENNSRPDEESSPSPTPKPTAKPSPKSTKSAEPTRTRTADRPAPVPKRTRR